MPITGTKTDAPKKKDVWDKASVLSALLASVLVPVSLAFVGQIYSKATAEAQNSVKYTELAISILKERPSYELANVRKWAINIASKHSGVPLDDQAQRELEKNRLNEAVDKIVLHGPLGRVIVTEFIEQITKSDDLRDAMTKRDGKKITEILRPRVVSLVETLQNMRDDVAPRIEESAQQTPSAAGPTK